MSGLATQGDAASRRVGVAELEAPPPLMGETASSCRMRTVEERETHAAAVAKAFCEPSEFIVLFAVARPVTYCNK